MRVLFGSKAGDRAIRSERVNSSRVVQMSAKRDRNRKFSRSVVPEGSGHALDNGESRPVERKSSQDRKM
jgi:hypothetical protein